MKVSNLDVCVHMMEECYSDDKMAIVECIWYDRGTIISVGIVVNGYFLFSFSYFLSSFHHMLIKKIFIYLIL